VGLYPQKDARGHVIDGVTRGNLPQISGTGALFLPGKLEGGDAQCSILIWPGVVRRRGLDAPSLAPNLTLKLRQVERARRPVARRRWSRSASGKRDPCGT